MNELLSTIKQLIEKELPIDTKDIKVKYVNEDLGEISITAKTGTFQNIKYIIKLDVLEK